MVGSQDSYPLSDGLANNSIVITTTNVWAMVLVSLSLATNQPIMQLFARRTLLGSNTLSRLATVEYR
jgi:hypothetical protein